MNPTIPIPSIIASGPKQEETNTAIPYPIPKAIAPTINKECIPKKKSLHFVSRITSTINVKIVVNPSIIDLKAPFIYGKP